MRYFPPFLLLILVGCASNSFSSATPIPASGETDMPAFRYLALGDSYTIGERVSARKRWPNQLAKLLEAEGIKTDVTIIARTGWTVDELWEGVQANAPEGTYDLLTLLIGVNDQYRGYPVGWYREKFRFMLDTEPISQQIDEYNAINLEETKSIGAHYVDVTIISRMGMDDFELIAGDRLHPSGKMYAMWAEKVLPLALEALR
jgi:lysophospholipase L1-like esterase